MNQENISVTIEKLAYGGLGLTQVDGKTCFVEAALPGEKVKIEITDKKDNYLHAKTLEVVTPSVARIKPECVYDSQCEGCQYQHASYKEELKWKEIQIQEYATRELGIDKGRVQSIVASPLPLGYRQSLTLHPSQDIDTPWGFIGKDNKTVFPVKECLLAKPALQASFKSLPSKNTKSKTFKIDSEDNIITNQKDQYYEIIIGNRKLITHTKSFIQNNFEVTNLIGEAIAKKVHSTQSENFLDLYSGLGTFSVLAAQNCHSWHGFEENPFGVIAFEKNRSHYGKSGSCLEGPVEKSFPNWYVINAPANQFLFLDPPRKGMDSNLCKFIGQMNSIQNVAYLSCHLGTLVRDLKEITKTGRLKIQEIIPFDMFPRTKHIEILVFLEEK